MNSALDLMFPFWTSMAALVLAQALKPVFHFLFHHKWVPSLCFSSGAFPSSHSAMVSALTLSVGYQERFTSTLFVVTLVFAIIVIYDAANVRYYAGQNIQITKQLIKDLQVMTEFQLDDPIYFSKVKDVLGHKWTEVIGGIALGLIIAYVMFQFY